MTTFATVHLVLLCLMMPVAIFLFRRRFVLWRILGLLPSVIWVLAVALLTDEYPPDFLWRHKLTRVVIPVGDYRVEVMQWPGFEFYSSNLRVRSPDSQIACYSFHSDDRKWWFPRVTKSNNKIMVSSWFGLVPILEANTENNVIVTSYLEKLIDISKLEPSDEPSCLDEYTPHRTEIERQVLSE